MCTVFLLGLWLGSDIDRLLTTLCSIHSIVAIIMSTAYLLYCFMLILLLSALKTGDLGVTGIGVELGSGSTTWLLGLSLSDQVHSKEWENVFISNSV